ncbi:MAG: hypothetical protein ACOYCB_12115, partial [Fastidiosipilaceae bacterium]
CFFDNQQRYEDSFFNPFYVHAMLPFSVHSTLPKIVHAKLLITETVVMEKPVFSAISRILGLFSISFFIDKANLN